MGVIIRHHRTGLPWIFSDCADSLGPRGGSWWSTGLRRTQWASKYGVLQDDVNKNSRPFLFFIRRSLFDL